MSVLSRRNKNSVKNVLPKQEHATEMETCEFTFEWTIKKFSQYKSGIIESPNFSSNFSDFDDVWILKLDPYRTVTQVYFNNTAEHTFVSVQLKLLSFNDTSRLFTKYKILIHPNIKIDEKYDYDIFPQESEWMNCLSRKGLLSLPNTFLKNDELKISCTLTIYKEKKINSLTSTIIPTGQLNEDLKKLLLNEKSADVTIKVGQKSFRVIKGILAVRSPVFHAMFDHEQFEENKNSEVVIEDIEEDVFEEFLHYIYTDETKDVDSMPMELLEVAEKYQVDRLKKICEGIICRTLNYDNVTSILIFSDKYNAENLNKECLKFIKKNFQDVSLNASFQVYLKTHPEVYVSVL